MNLLKLGPAPHSLPSLRPCYWLGPPVQPIVPFQFFGLAFLIFRPAALLVGCIEEHPEGIFKIRHEDGVAAF